MKEFEKWWKEVSKDEMRYMPEDDYVAKDGWKAALEWVLDMKKEDVYGGDVHNKAYHIPDWAIDIIEDELKG